MSMWDIASYAAWGIASLLLIWIVYDAIKVSQQYDEGLLMSSREGVDEMADTELANAETTNANHTTDTKE